MSLKLTRSTHLFEQARKILPGGVNSPVRSFSAVGGQAFVATRGQGPYLYDADGNKYIDLVCSWGPLIHGHNHPIIRMAIEKALQNGTSFGVNSEIEIQLGQKLVDSIPSLEMLRLVNSGTEACMSAIRLARAATKREYIIKFEGHYHGHADSFLVAAGSGLASFGMSSSAGVPEKISAETLILPFNNVAALEECFSKYGNQIAGVILEVVTGNMGVVAPDLSFLKKLRELSKQYSSVLIFDEVMTGFRLSLSGAQGLYGIEPDLSCFGKIIGGGLPVGAYGGKKEIMQLVSPLGPMYQAGTLSGNPLCAAAGLASLELILEDSKIFYQRLDAGASEWRSLMEAHITRHSYPVSVAQMGSMLTIFFSPEKPKNYVEARTCDLEKFKSFFWKMLERGIYYPPSQFEACFLSTAHKPEIMERLAEVSLQAMDECFEMKL